MTTTAGETARTKKTCGEKMATCRLARNVADELTPRNESCFQSIAVLDRVPSEDHHEVDV